MNLFDDLTLVKIKNQEKQREEKRLINNLEQQEKFVEMESAVMENQESFFFEKIWSFYFIWKGTADRISASWGGIILVWVDIFFMKITIFLIWIENCSVFFQIN